MTEKKLIPEGFYEGKLLDYGIRMTRQTNQPAVTAVFHVIYENSNYNVYWQGTFKGKDGVGTNETTLKALVVMGLDSVNRIGDLAAQKASGALNTEKKYNLKIGVDYDPKTGKSHNKVAFVNEIGGGGALKDLVHPNDFLPMVQNLGIAGDLQRLILEVNGGSVADKSVSNQFTDDIAF